ncbi:hypothetical protein A4X13_0g4636 [Tilletia indica]|uniref:Uncharacterized protein n=1 Tax=Tilletia indica TaxID=43049 RepID=A0A177T7N3_9BASI|nr:hypothetical protein A4X13_0g4636 [Tilletia indica]
MSTGTEVIFYDVAASDGPGCSHILPNPWVTRLCLVHKGIDFKTHNVSLEELRAHGSGTLRERLQDTLGPNDRPLVPMVEVRDTESGKDESTLVGDTVTIAEYLDIKFPKMPSLFQPSHTGPLPPDPNSSEYRQAHTMSILLKEGIGNSDSQWATHFELCAAEIADRFKTRDAEYLKSDAKLGMANAWKLFESMNRADLLAHTRRSLLPFCAILNPRPSPRITSTSSPAGTASSLLARSSVSPPLFLASPDRPGFLDYVLFGRYAMSYGSAPEINKAIWSKSSKEGREWLGSYRDGKWALKGNAAEKGQWFGDVELPGIEEWVERMLDAHDGYARKYLN